MNEMVERVAKALFQEMTNGSGHDGSGQRVDVRYFESVARAAIEAMREPTDEMCIAGARSIECGSRYEAEVYWVAMVEAVLDTPSPPSPDSQ